MNHAHIIRTLHELADRFPPDLRNAQHKDVPRIAFHIEAVLRTGKWLSPGDLEIADIGGASDFSLPGALRWVSSASC